MRTPSHSHSLAEAPGWLLPGRWVWCLVLVALLVVVGSGMLSTWLVSRALGQEAMRRLVTQQNEEVEVVARLLASKIEQSQKILRSVADGMTPAMLGSPAALEGVFQKGFPAARLFDALHVVRRDGELQLSLRDGHLQKASDLDSAERDLLRRTLVDGKPLVSDLLAVRTSEARVMFTMPLRHDDGAVAGVLAASLKLHSQGLLPPSMGLPAREDSKLLVFTRDGTILSHSDAKRVMGYVRDEPGVGVVVSQWQQQPIVGRAASVVESGHVVSVAGMPLPQWFVARVTDSSALLAPLQGVQREAWWLAAAVVVGAAALLTVVMVWMAQPLVRLSRSARSLLLQGSPQFQDWPKSSGEVGSLIEVFQGLLRQGAQQRQVHDVLAGQFQAILDHAPVGIVITRQGVLELVGRQACTMLGYAVAELQGKPARALYASDADYERMGSRVQAEFLAHGRFDGDVRFVRKDGTAVWARVQGQGVVAGQVHDGTVWILEDITAALEDQQQQAWDASHDPLTQLLNRHAFEQRLRGLLAERAQRPRQHGGEGTSVDAVGDGVVLFLDIDHFTVVNDIAGHDAGDDVLRHIARLLESHLRQIGWAARLGGDEFAVVLPGCSLARGHAVAEQLRAVVAAWEPSYRGRSFTLGLSIGLVLLDASLDDVPSVMYAADMACYDAKRAGRNRVEARPAREAGVSGRMALGPA